MFIRIQRNERYGNGYCEIYADGKLFGTIPEQLLSVIGQGFYRIRATMSRRYGKVLPIVDFVIGVREARLLSDGRGVVDRLTAKLIEEQNSYEESWMDLSDYDPTAAGYDNATTNV